MTLHAEPLADEQEVVYRLDRDDHIVYAEEGFRMFAARNHTPELTTDAVLGKSIWGYIYGRETRYLHRVLLEKVRDRQQTFTLPFRCDSPDRRRFLTMTISAGPDDTVEYRSRTIREEVRSPVALSTSAVEPSDALLRMCSWCKKLEVEEHTWLELEEAIERLRLFEAQPPPKITHGMCPICFEQIMGTLQSSGSPVHGPEAD
jgi:hypothetical protein